MIKVTIEQRSSDQSVVGFTVDGHADFDESGKDIVCAGVSAVTVGAVNAVEALLNISMEANMKSGLLQVLVPHDLDRSTWDQLQLILNTMIVMLQSIEQSYGQYINITFKQRR